MTPSIVSGGGLRREVFAYHPSTGAITTHSITGWNESVAQETHTTSTSFYGDANSFAPAFDPGGTFQPAWLALPQPPLRRSVDGPRTDVADVAAFVYYPVDSSVTPATLRGRVAAVRNAAGQITRYQGYDSFGNATRVVDANGVASEMTFDALGRVVLSTLKGIPGCDTSKDPLCGSDLTTSRAYASQAGPVQSEQRPAGGVTVYDYDSHGRMHSLSRGPAGNDLRERIEYTYDPLSGLKSAERFFARENAAWIEKRSESYGYDSLGQLQTATHADGTSVAYTYDRLGRVATVRDENHAAANSSYSYDPAGRIATVRQTLTGAPNGFITTGYSYDLHGNLIRVVDPNGNATDYHYDDFGRMVSQQSPVTGTTQYRYDPAGNMTFTQDANGATTQRTYDVLGRVTSSISTKGASGETITWTYDSPVAGDFASGRLSSMNDPSGSTSYVYDRRGSLRQEIKTIDGSSYTTGYQYDADANRALIRYPSGRTVTYTYDFAGRPQSASTGSTALVTSARYLPFGPVSEIVYGNGTTKTVQYDSRYRVMQNGLAGPAGTIAAYDYAYDAVGNVTQLHDSTNPAFNRDFAYDDLNRLTTANSGSSLWGSGSYNYDRMGNLLSSALGANRQSSFVYSGTTPKITAATENGIPRSITYDAAGNESVVGAAAFAYSPRNHLVAGDGLNYAYDGRGVRVATSYPAVAIASLTVSPSTLYTNETATGTVTLGAAAPAGGAVVSLTSSNPALIVPATITVPAGGTTAIFGIALAANMSSGGAVITANYYLKRTAAVTLISGPALSSIVVNPATLAGGSTAQGTITLQGPAPSVGAVVMLSSSHSAVGVPSTVTIPANETTATFTVSSLPVSASASSTITATYNGTSTATVTVSPAKLTAITIEPQTVMGGHSALGTVTLDGLAVSDITVTLTSSNPQTVTVPATIVIPAGTASRSFTILTSASVSSPISVTITGTADSITRSATLTVTACIPATAPAPSIPAGDTVWIDDETPAGATIYGSPVWDATQKASGTKSVTRPLQLGAWEMGFVGATSTMPVYYNENLVFYALLSECVPPTRITVQWRTTDGVYHNALWGVAHPAFPTIGPVPAAGGWVRFEVPARQLNMEGKTVDSVFVGGLDGQAWFDRFGKGGTACIPAAAAPPTIPSGDTVWIDDETPAGATIYGSPVWDATQKASGTKSVTKPFQMGPWDIGFIGATTTMPVHFNENLVFYALLSECVPPSRITVQWKTTDGVYHNALWGVPHTAFPAPIGPLPAAGGWVRFEVSARQLNMEGKTVDSVFVGGLDGQAWFDHFGKSGTACIPAIAPPPSIPSGDTVWIDDETPAGATVDGSPVWDAMQKASGTRSVTKPFQTGEWWMGFIGATTTMPVHYNESLVFYARLSECTPPSRIMIQWRTTDGVYHNALWGVPRASFPTVGPLPAAGGWVRFEVPARQLNMEGKAVDSVYVGGLDGQAWFDHFGKSGTGCNPSMVPPPSIPGGDTVWIDDETPAGATLYNQPVWDAAQKASGAKSLTKPFQLGAWETGLVGATATMPVYTGENVVFYALLNVCVPPSRITIQWRTTDGVYHNALWGTPHPAFPTIGPLPAAGSWARFEVSARQLNLEGKSVDSVFVGGLDGQAWFDRFGKAPVQPVVLTSLSPDRVSPQMFGTAITWTAQATGGVSPLEYRFLARKESIGVNNVVRDWSTSNTYVWTPGSNDVGGWQIHVHVRSAGATQEESYRVASYMVTIGEPAVVTALTPDKPSPQPVGTTVLWTAQVTGGVAPLQYRFLERDVDVGVNNVVQDWNTSNTYQWTRGLGDVGDWQIHVHVRSTGVIEVESYLVANYKLTVGAPAVVTALTPDQASPRMQGTPITWTAQASGGVGPLEYRFLARKESIGVNNIVRDWSTSNTYVWTPGPNDIGSWQIHVHVRSAGATQEESYRVASYMVTIGEPAVVTALTPDKPSSQPAGTTVVWTAQVTGGVAPLQYRFLERDVDVGVNNVVQDWSTSNTYYWTRGLSDVGDWMIHVHVRSAGATEVESYRIAGFTLTAAPAVLTGFTADKTSPQPAGAAITWTATAVGSVQPLQYRFERRDDGVWHEVQAYSSSNTYSWTPTASDAGDHVVRVSVRNAGSTAEFEDTESLEIEITTNTGSLTTEDVPVALSVTARYVETTSEMSRNYSLYTPELRLLAETKTTTTTTPAVAYEYVWFGGQPLAQIETSTGAVSYYFNDHLGTPLLQTAQNGDVVWRAEYEPYGTVYTFRAGADKHQPLRFPGQESDGDELSYNIFRWYRAGWGRYTQADPLANDAFTPNSERRRAARAIYEYTPANPLRYADPLGLKPKSCPGSCGVDCPGGAWIAVDGNIGGGVLFGANYGVATAFCTSSSRRCSFEYKCVTVGLQAFVGASVTFSGLTDCYCAASIAETDSLSLGPLSVISHGTGGCGGLGIGINYGLGKTLVIGGVCSTRLVGCKF